MTELPEYYFRIRENGAAVFRVSTENRQRRIEMEEIAVVNIRNGNIRPHGETVLSPGDLSVIEAWMEDRRAVLADRDIDDIHRAIDYLNLTTHWAQTRASDEDLEDVTDRLLLAMHDLRTVLVRKKADRILATRPAPGNGADTTEATGT
ncbi:hypothetical protein [Roseicyclus mahoneyensis]|uniref:Uncharacterized protein n=1 Tax=Roseicyclus mahoneyensis TaxID=164332 RepID=A0A316GQU2_9RHOB|nr:hypothetical protein [Roseicyclus mahoneyensis]PWK62771.1 hypothetical protein C7455_101807 [Roseicyclus mahoneyensis]